MAANFHLDDMASILFPIALNSISLCDMKSLTGKDIT